MNKLKCPDCSTKFDRDQHTPVILPMCGHTFCLQCLQKQFQSKNYIKCSRDQKQYASQYTPENLPINEMLLVLMDDLSRQKENYCSQHNKKLEYFCLDDKVIQKD